MHFFKILKTRTSSEHEEQNGNFHHDHEKKKKPCCEIKKIEEIIDYGQVMAKIRFDFRYGAIDLTADQKALLRSHKNYHQSHLSNRKLNTEGKQNINHDFEKVKIKHLTYRLDILWS